MQRKYKHTTVKKYMGDDNASWAVFNKHTGQPVVTGLMRREATYHRNRIEDKLSERG